MSRQDLIDEMRAALDKLEAAEANDEQHLFLANSDALELPELVSAVVDYLQPLLQPYEAAIYWHLFRSSIVAHGKQYLRVSTRGLQNGVVESSSGQSAKLSYAAVQKALEGLQEKGAISKAGDTTREGTLYKVCLPDEIPIAETRRHELKPKLKTPIEEERDLDFYNVAENRLKVFERDDYRCHYCKKQLTRFTATLDHIQPVSEGGDNSFLNLTTACLHCNSRRGSRPVMEAIVSGTRDDG